jgi:surfeit locus 1 family protein
VAVLLALTLLLSLGTWQVRRLAWKTELIETIAGRSALPPVAVEAALADPVGNDYRHVEARGRYRHDLSFALGAVGLRGELGSRLVTPLELGDGRLLLVERGWLPDRLLPPATPEALEPRGEVEVAGVARWHGADRPGAFTPANLPERRRWHWYDLPALAETWGAELAPMVVVAGGPGALGGLPQPLPVHVDLPNNHLGYAVTWYGLAVALVAVYLVFGFRRGKE